MRKTIEDEMTNNVIEVITALYKHFDDTGKLLYVGVAGNTWKRTKEHSKASQWFTRIARIQIVHFPSREKALEAERIAIMEENPECNRLRPDPGHGRKEEKRCEKEYWELSRNDLLRRVVTFKALYSMREAAELLMVSTEQINNFMDSGVLGYISRPTRPSRHYPNGRTTRICTGWHLIDFIEYLEEMEQQNKQADLPDGGAL